MGFIRKINGILNRNEAIVLMYHRIANLSTDPWQLSVSPANFEQQLTILKNEYTLIPVAELLKQLSRGKIKKKTICITFDDGYVDNLINAAPLLQRYDCPATFFIATGSTNQKKLFWWDLLEEIFLKTVQLPSALHSGPFNFILENNGLMKNNEAELHKTWKWPEQPPTQRSQIYLAIWEYLKPLPNDEIIRYIDMLTEWSGIKIVDIEESIPMSDEELIRLASNKLFSIGVHTVNHPALGCHSQNIQQYELENSRNYLASLLSRYLNVVAYPYGHYNADTIGTMKYLQFDGGFTTEEKTVNSKSKIYQLGRFQVKNWTGPEFKDQLNTWLRN